MYIGLANKIYRESFSKKGSVTPVDIAGLSLWYEVREDSVVKDGAGSVSQLTDLSGNSNHASQLTLGNQYQFVPNAQNGQAAVSGTIGDFYNYPGQVFEGTDYTFFIVLKRTSGGRRGILGSTEAFLAATPFYFHYQFQNVVRVNNRSAELPNQDFALPTGAFDGNNTFFDILSVRFSQTEGLKVYQKDVLFGNNPSYTTPNASNPNAAIGRVGSASGSVQYFVGEFASFVQYGRHLSESEHAGVLGYLRGLYGI